MSTTHPYRKLSRELKAYNNRLDEACRRKYGMTLRTFKTLKVTGQIVGVVGVLWTVTLTSGTDPELAAILITTILAGGELAEYFTQLNNPGE